MRRLTTIERAFELARSGTYSNLGKLRQALSKEGYGDVRAQLDGRSIQAQLNALLDAAMPGRTDVPHDRKPKAAD